MKTQEKWVEFQLSTNYSYCLVSEENILLKYKNIGVFLDYIWMIFMENQMF